MKWITGTIALLVRFVGAVYVIAIKALRGRRRVRPILPSQIPAPQPKERLDPIQRFVSRGRWVVLGMVALVVIAKALLFWSGSDRDHGDTQATSIVGLICVPNERRPCGPQIGACRPGYEICNEGREWSLCVEASSPSDEVMDDLDNDCDGLVDEGFTDCPPGQVTSCGSDVGACEFGTRICMLDRQWGDCVGQTNPQAEVLGDNLDNDCDGATDELESPASPETALRECQAQLPLCEQIVGDLVSRLERCLGGTPAPVPSRSARHRRRSTQ